MICRVCLTDKTNTDFPRDKTLKSGYRNECKDCHNTRQRNSRKNDPERFRQYDKRKWQVDKGAIPRRKQLGIDSHYQFKRKFLDRVKSSRKCTICQEGHPRCLSFHHINPSEKLFTVGYITGKTLRQLKEEIRKCVVLCENCHRKQHAATRTSHHPRHKQRKHDILNSLKKQCLLCSEQDVVCLDFHHRDSSQKSFTIGENLNQHSIEELLEETKLCDVLCANCHRKISH